VNDTPIITSLPPTAVIGINQYYSYYIVATDTDFDRINFTLINAPAGMIIRDSEYLITAQNSICTALIEWRPQTSGVYNFSARVSDTSNAAALQNITISVINRPMNVYKLTAELTDLNNALLTWIETPETNIVNYQIYKSDNFGNLNFDSVYSIIAAPADSIVIQLNGDTMTKFSVLPINNVGLTADTLTAPVVIVYKNPNNISSVVWTKIVNPLNGFTVSGDYIQVRAELVKGNLSDIKSLAFYYKTEEEATWKLMKIYYTGIEKNIDNPLTNINTTDDLFINWNIKNLANGSYLIKSEATDKNNVVEPCPIAVKIVKGSNIVNSDYYFDAVSYPSPITAQTLIPGLKGDNEAVIISTQTNSVYGEAFNTKITVEIPGNAIDTTQPIGSQKIVMMPINETLMKDYNIKTPSADTAYANMVVLNVVDTQTLASGNLVNKILNHGTTQFNNKVRVKMSYLDKDGDGWLDNMRNIRQEWLRIYYRHNINDDWKSLPHDQLKINFEDNLAEFEIDHFTIFLLSPDTEFVRSVIASGLPITVYPNPYIPSKNNEQGRPFKTEYQNLNDADLGGIVFRNLGDTVTPATIKIFTLSGQLVREKITTTSYWIWDTKNDKGKEVASGWYLYLVEINGIKKTGKLAIIR
ncbi:MAG TPA: hypothetical protein PLJ38_01825, partial [bacterium]|nr:hypothetical protein [bacterium]